MHLKFKLSLFLINYLRGKAALNYRKGYITPFMWWYNIEHTRPDLTKMIEYIAKFFLELTSYPAYLIICSIGYLRINKRVFFHATQLLFVASIFNALLKSYFQVPPLPGHSGFSFPSGHEQVAATFWFFLLLWYRTPLIITTGLVCIFGIAFSLVYFEHHYTHDVAAAILFSLLTVVTYLKLTQHKLISSFFGQLSLLSRVGIVTSLPCLCFLLFSTPIPKHLWFSALLLVTLFYSHTSTNNKIHDGKNGGSLGSLLSVLIGLAIIQIMCSLLCNVYYTSSFYVTGISLFISIFIITKAPSRTLAKP